MPQHLKSQLFPLLVGCFGNPELFIQWSSSDYVNGGVLPPFDCIHFSWYNRYTTKVISPCLIYTLHFSHAFAEYRGSQCHDRDIPPQPSHTYSCLLAVQIPPEQSLTKPEPIPGLPDPSTAFSNPSAAFPKGCCTNVCLVSIPEAVNTILLKQYY